MLNPVTPWTATVQSDIINGNLLWEAKISQYQLRIYNAGDSLWLTVEWPEGGTIAFRLAFGMNSFFEKIDITKDDENGVVFYAFTRLAVYSITLSYPQKDPLVLRYTTTLRVTFPLLIPYWPRDIVPLTIDGQVENTAAAIHTKQVGARSGQLFFSLTKPETGSVFYFQNLTAMCPYCEITETSLSESVGGDWPEIGFQFPVNRKKPLPANIEYTISDAFVSLDENIYQTDSQITSRFLDNLATLYVLIPKPKPNYKDWSSISDKALSGLHTNKGCWTITNGSPFLNPYAADYSAPAEIMVQLSVLLPLHEYLKWSDKKHPLYDDLINGLSDFYDPNINTIVRWHPALEDKLDKSEEQKREMVMDSWYLHHPLLNLAGLALRGDKIAEKLFLDSIDYAIKVAHHFNYKWPIFYKMSTLEIIKAEATPGNGGENDVPGSYAHIMLMAYKLTGEKRFMNEAITALKSLEGLAFDIFYQANNTAFAAGALVEMYKETNDEKYLNLSYSCLAGIFKNVHLWECYYGYGKNFPYFFAVYPLNDAPYTAAYEEFEVFAALHHYMEVTADVEILPALKILIPEFIKYAIARMPFYYPPLLPKEMIADHIKNGEIEKDLWVPLEDIQDGWEKSGQVGQEVYGAGIPFGVMARQYFKLEELNATGFINYPSANFRFGKKNVTFYVVGDARFDVYLKISGLSKAKLSKIKVEVKNKRTYQQIKESVPGTFEFTAGTTVRISW
jgi:hypothetical protein